MSICSKAILVKQASLKTFNLFNRVIGQNDGTRLSKDSVPQFVLILFTISLATARFGLNGTFN